MTRVDFVETRIRFRRSAEGAKGTKGELEKNAIFFTALEKQYTFICRDHKGDCE